MGQDRQDSKLLYLHRMLKVLKAGVRTLRWWNTSRLELASILSLMSSLISTAAKPIDELTIYYLRKQDDSQRIRILEAENGILEAKNENMRLKLQVRTLSATPLSYGCL